MRFKLDENLNPDLASILRAGGHDTDTVLDEHISGVSDDVIYATCRNVKRALVTLDMDFSNPLRFPPSVTEGIIVLRPVRQTLPMIETLVRELGALLTKQNPFGQLWIVEPGSVRIYRRFN